MTDVITLPQIDLELKEAQVLDQKVFYMEGSDGLLYDIVLPEPLYEKAKPDIREKFTKGQYLKDTQAYINAVVVFLQDRMKVSASVAMRLVRSMWEAKA